MQMIFIKANRLELNAGHTSKQLRKDLSNIIAYARIQDPASNTGTMGPLFWLAKMGKKPKIFL